MISIKNASKRYGSVVAVNDIDLEIDKGEFFALLGPSGCGKTTLLRMIAGLEVPTGGQITIDGEDMAGVMPNRRPVNMVFQSYAVFPHMSVFDNVAYGLKVSKTRRSEIHKRVTEALDLVQLSDYAKRMPAQLSGGQRQRVALARALVKRPKVLLLDEPLSALDAKLRETMQIELVKLQKSVGITFVIVTHDQDEALGMADRIAVMEHGIIRQLDRPRTLYDNPVDEFVASFIGKMNFFDGRVDANHQGIMSIGCDEIGRFELNGDLDIQPVRIAVRPENIELHPSPHGNTDADKAAHSQTPSESITLPVSVDQVVYRGNETQVIAITGKGKEINCVINKRQTRAAVDSGLLTAGRTANAVWLKQDTLVLPF